MIRRITTVEYVADAPPNHNPAHQFIIQAPTQEVWENQGSLPYDESRDMLHFDSTTKSVTVYRRR